MSRQSLPFFANDVSGFARALRRELSQSPDGSPAATPSHLTLLNMVARAGGYQNFQHFRAQASAREKLEQTQVAPATEPADYVAVGRLARYFDEAGRLIRWPGKYSHRVLCLLGAVVAARAAQRLDRSRDQPDAERAASVRRSRLASARDVHPRADEAHARRARISAHRADAARHGARIDPPPHAARAGLNPAEHATAACESGAQIR